MLAFGGIALGVVHPALTLITWGCGLGYALYRIVTDSKDVVVGWGAVAEQLGLSMEGGSRWGVALQLTNYAPQLHGTYRGVELKVYLSTVAVEAALNSHDKSAWHMGRNYSMTTSGRLKGNVPLTVFELPYTDEINERFVFGELEYMQLSPALRKNSVAFAVRGVLEDPEEIIEYIEDLVTSVERTHRN